MKYVVYFRLFAEKKLNINFYSKIKATMTSKEKWNRCSTNNNKNCN